MADSIVNGFFAWAPLVSLAVILVILYYSTRRSHYSHATAGAVAVKTYSCARCGRRGPREVMIPLTEKNATIFYCRDCTSANSA